MTKHSEKSDILTPWKEAERYRREVYVASGSPEKAVRSGMFHRVTNPSKPELNSRDGLARPRGTSDSLRTHVQEYGGAEESD